MSWRAEAACRSSKIELFFPEPGAPAKEAIKICTDCGVRSECLEDALKKASTAGIWGGTTQRQRERIQRQRDEERRRQR